jgi:Gpi18-like mannosyltransferase
MTEQLISREKDSSPAPALGPPRRVLNWLGTPRGLAALFAVGLGIRLLAAVGTGFFSDLRYFQIWSARLARIGPGHFYAPGYFSDYPPGYLYILLALGKLSQAVWGTPPSFFLLKLPSIFADLALAWIAGEFAVAIASAQTQERLPVRNIAAAAILLNPAVIALSAVWGQVDVIPATLVVGALLLLYTGEPRLRRELPAFLLFTLAVAMKPQSAFLFPAVGLSLYWRHHGWRDSRKRVREFGRIVLLGLVSFGLWALTGLPFNMYAGNLLAFYSRSASLRPVTSAYAFNLWGAFGFYRNDLSGDNVVTVLGIPALYVGIAIFVIGVTLVLRRAYRSLARGDHEGLTLLVASACIALIAYAGLTRMHERYLFPSLACLAPMAFIKGFRRGLAVLSALFIVNLYFAYVYWNQQFGFPALKIQLLFSWLYGGNDATAPQKALWSLVVAAACFVVVVKAERWSRSELSTRHVPQSRPPREDVKGFASHVRDASASAMRTLRQRVPGQGAGYPAPGRVVEVRAEPSPHPSRGVVRWGPIALVGLAVAFNLWGLRAETAVVEYQNDSALHLQMVRWAAQRIQEGHLPFDGWYPYHALGSAFFRNYQSLPHIITAYVGHLIGVDRAFRWSLYLLLALWPISVYAGARLMGWGRWAAGASALVSPLIVSTPGYGFEHGSYTWYGWGVWSQLWGMWLLPISWGLTWRAISRGRGYALASLSVALTIACHFMTGYLALVSIGVWVLIKPPEFLRRFGRAAIVGVGSLGVAAWVLVPLFQYRTFINQSLFYRGSFLSDSFGAKKILGWLFTGQMFDRGRLPVLSLLVALGIVVCASMFRRDDRARALLGVGAFSLVLFFGRPTLGPLLKLLPGADDLQLHRFINGVDLAGILLAGVGLAWLGRHLRALLRHLSWGVEPVTAGIAAVAFVVVLTPAWTERVVYDRTSRDAIHFQQLADETDGRNMTELIQEIKDSGAGRVFAGLRGTWGADYRVGYVPTYSYLEQEGVDSIGYPFRTIASLSSDVETLFDENNPADYNLYDVRYLLMPSDRQPAVPATFVDRKGNNVLWQVQTSGYLQVVDTQGVIVADRSNIGEEVTPFLHSNTPATGPFPTIAFAGALAAPGSLNGPEPEAVPGHVLREVDGSEDGVFAGTVQTDRAAVVLLKVTFDPRWTATVDGARGATRMGAPTFVGGSGPPGRHSVAFAYSQYPGYLALFSVGILFLILLRLASNLLSWTDVPVRQKRLPKPAEV